MLGAVGALLGSFKTKTTQIKPRRLPRHQAQFDARLSLPLHLCRFFFFFLMHPRGISSDASDFTVLFPPVYEMRWIVGCLEIGLLHCKLKYLCFCLFRHKSGVLDIWCGFSIFFIQALSKKRKRKRHKKKPMQYHLCKIFTVTKVCTFSF